MKLIAQILKSKRVRASELQARRIARRVQKTQFMQAQVASLGKYN